MNYDVRPLDTNIIITNRNRIRLYSILSIFGVMVYLALNNEFQQTHLSHLHIFHVLVQPVLLFNSINDDSGIAYGATIISAVPVFLDVFVCIISLISILRCYTELTASCFDRLYEQGSWFLLSSYLTILNLLNCLHNYSLMNHLKEKDAKEKQKRELARARKNIVPSRRYMSYALKTQVINIFLLVLDGVYIIDAAILSNDTPFFIAGSFHIFLDAYGAFMNSKGSSSFFYIIMRLMYFISFFLYIILMLILLQLDTEWNVSKFLMFMLTFLYIVTDSIQLYFLGAVLNALPNE